MKGWVDIAETVNVKEMLGDSDLVWLYGRELIEIESGEIMSCPVLCTDLYARGGILLGVSAIGHEYMCATHYMPVHLPTPPTEKGKDNE